MEMQKLRRPKIQIIKTAFTKIYLTKIKFSLASLQRASDLLAATIPSLRVLFAIQSCKSGRKKKLKKERQIENIVKQ